MRGDILEAVLKLVATFLVGWAVGYLGFHVIYYVVSGGR